MFHLSVLIEFTLASSLGFFLSLYRGFFIVLSLADFLNNSVS